MNRKYLFAILFIAIAITFCGTAAAEEQNIIQDNSIVDTSNTTNTTNSTQDNQSDTNQETTDDQGTNNETTENTPLASTMASTSDPTPEIVITFDDGFESAYTVAYPIMQQYGIKGTVYVNTAWVGQPGYLTLQQLTELHNAGWTIANHAWHHPALPTLSKEEITNEIQTAINWLKDNGFQDGAYHLAYPYGQYNDTVIEVCSELGIKTARTVNWGTISHEGYTLPYEQPLDYLQLPMILFSKDTTTNDWKLEIDSSIAQKTIAIFLLHNIVSNPDIYEDVSITTFTEFIAYIAQTGTKTLTINQWYNEMDNVAPVPSADLASGSYNTNLTINLSATDNMDSNPTIYYTLDGTTPTTSSTLYTGPISLNGEGTTILKFIAVDYTGNISNVTERTYTIDKKAPTAYANSKGGLYNYDKNVRLYMSKPGNIYYTLNGSTPTTSSTKYVGGPILISSTTTLKFIAVDLAGNSSPVYTEVYTIEKVRPIINYTTPIANATSVSTTNTIVVKFSENIQKSINWNNFWIKNISTQNKVAITYWISGDTLYIKTTSPLAANTWYQMYIPGYSVKDNAGNNLASGYWPKFKTEPDKVRPTITSVSIKNLATGVSRTSTIVIKFSENIKTSINWNKFYIKNLSTGKTVSISKWISGNTLYLKTTSSRTAYTWYQVYIPGYSVKDSASNNLASGYWFKFQTGK